MRNPIGKRVRIIEVFQENQVVFANLYFAGRDLPINLYWKSGDFKVAILSQKVSIALSCGFGRIRPFLSGDVGWSWWRETSED